MCVFQFVYLITDTYNTISGCQPTASSNRSPGRVTTAYIRVEMRGKGLLFPVLGSILYERLSHLQLRPIDIMRRKTFLNSVEGEVRRRGGGGGAGDSLESSANDEVSGEQQWNQFPWIKDPRRSEVANNLEAGLSGMKREQST